MSDLYAAQLDGFALEIETTDDALEKAIVRHEYPFKDGAFLEDMGQKARVVRFRCYFWDDGADRATYDTHHKLLKHLQSQETSELVHPKYGPLRGCVESMSVRHDDRERTAEIDIVFVQGLLDEDDDTGHEDVAAGSEEAFDSSIVEQKHAFTDEVTAALGAEAPAILAKTLDPDRSIVEQFPEVSIKARAYLKGVESYVSTLETTLNIITNPASSLISTINYGATLAGRVIGSLSRTVERYALLYSSLQTAPARFMDGLLFALEGLAASSGKFSRTTKIAGASHAALQAAYLYRADEAVRSAQKKNEGLRPFDALGNYAPPESAPGQTMTVHELEGSLAAVRGSLQEAIDLSRQNTSLKQQALRLQTHVNSIKLEREKITRVRLDNPMPLHLLCLRHGLPYNAADRLLSINAIKNPNCVSGEVNIYAAG